MRRVLLAVAMVYVTLFFIVAAAHADYYMYEDDKGTVTLTDDINKVPLQYRGVMNTLKPGEARTQGYVPTISEAIEAGKFGTDSWYDYGSMPFYERWVLLARAGYMDLVPMLKSMSAWIALSIVILGCLWFFIFKVFEQPRWRGLCMFLVLGFVSCGLFYQYLAVVQSRSQALILTIRKAREVNEESRRKLIGVLESIETEGASGDPDPVLLAPGAVDPHAGDDK